MNNLNSILIEGNLVRDPSYKETEKGTPFCEMTLASNRFFKNGSEAGLEKEVGFFDIEVRGKLAQSCKSNGRKGRGARVVGRLRQIRWTGNDGLPRSRVIIVAEHVEFRPEFSRTDLRSEPGEPEKDEYLPPQDYEDVEMEDAAEVIA
jgi:single-strand DNA-binding protein